MATAFWGHFQASSSFRSGDKGRGEGRPDVDLIDVGSDTAQGILNLSKDSSTPLSAIKGRTGFSDIMGTHCQRQHRDAVHKQKRKITRGISQVQMPKAEAEKHLDWLVRSLIGPRVGL
jgi:hypothetical protein